MSDQIKVAIIVVAAVIAISAIWIMWWKHHCWQCAVADRKEITDAIDAEKNPVVRARLNKAFMSTSITDHQAQLHRFGNPMDIYPSDIVRLMNKIKRDCYVPPM